MLFGEQEYEIAIDIGQEYSRWYNRPEIRASDVRSSQAYPTFIKKLKAIGLAGGVASTFLTRFAKNPEVASRYLRKTTNTIQPITPEKATKKRQADTPDTVPKKQKMSKVPWDEDAEEMEVESDGKVAVSALRSVGTQTATQSGVKMSGETPISSFNPFLGIPDTANVILPWTGYLTVVTPASKDNVQLELRLTSPYDFLVSTVTSPTGGTTILPGRFAFKPPFGSTYPGTWPTTFTPARYPTTIVDSTAEAPWYRGYYDKIYQKYTCLGSEYKITIVNCDRSESGRQGVVAYGIDSFSAANSGRRFPDSTDFQAFRYWPDLSFKTIGDSGDNTGDGVYTVIEGQYKTGTASRNVQNDEDIKTWTDVGSTPSLSEHLIMRFGNNEFNRTDVNLRFMVKMEMKFIVQFKDKKIQARYPLAGQTPFALNIPTDILQLV